MLEAFALPYPWMAITAGIIIAMGILAARTANDNWFGIAVITFIIGAVFFGLVGTIATWTEEFEQVSPDEVSIVMGERHVLIEHGSYFKLTDDIWTYKNAKNMKYFWYHAELNWFGGYSDLEPELKYAVSYKDIPEKVKEFIDESNH